jgi:hypothetical protein
MIINDNKNEQKMSKNFYCEKCHYNTCTKYNFSRHCLTDKHKMIINDNKSSKNEQKRATNKNNTVYECECGKKYKHLPNLCRHKKLNCKLTISKNNELSQIDTLQEPQDINYKEMVVMLINENKEMRKTISDLVPKIGNNNNNVTNNANFNLNIFLNEKCKDALTIDDFISKIEISLSNLLLTKDKGLVDGISNIFIENMNKLSLYERPLHCTDVNREILYIKQDEWKKDETKQYVKDAIKKISHIQTKNIDKWKNVNPYYMEDSDKKDEFIQLVKNTVDNVEQKQDKILKNICKNVYINDKTL